MMYRKSTDTVQINLRLKESLRRRLNAAAKRNQVSLNAEMVARLDRSLDQEAIVGASELVQYVGRFLGPLLADVQELNVSGDYRRAIGKLLALLRPLLPAGEIDQRTGEAILFVIDEIDKADAVCERAFGR